MANSYQIIDEKTWERAMHCMVFRNSVEPAFCVTFEADITNFKRMVKEQQGDLQAHHPHLQGVRGRAFRRLPSAGRGISDG